MTAQDFIDTCSKLLFKKQDKEFILNRLFIAKRNVPAYKDVSYKVYVRHGKSTTLAFTYEDTLKVISPSDTTNIDNIFIEKFLELILSNKTKIYETVKV